MWDPPTATFEDDNKCKYDYLNPNNDGADPKCPPKPANAKGDPLTKPQ